MVDDTPSLAERDLLVDSVVPAGGLRKAWITVYRHEGFLIEETATDTQAMVHLRHGSADADGYAASSAEVCKSAHNAGPGQCSFDERSYKLTTFAVENFKHLLKSGIEPFDRLASSLVRVAEDGNLRRKGW